jgi:hypothetical protein
MIAGVGRSLHAPDSVVRVGCANCPTVAPVTDQGAWCAPHSHRLTGMHQGACAQATRMKDATSLACWLHWVGRNAL